MPSRVKEVSPKLVKAAEIARGLITGKGNYSEKTKRNVIIYTLFRGNTRILEKLLHDYDPIVVSGDVGIEEREDKLVDFKQWNPDTAKHGKVLIANMQFD